jgi:hypothetical protein
LPISGPRLRAQPHLELVCGQDPAAEKLLAKLNADTEITFEFAVSDYNKSRYHGTIIWVAPIAHPDRKQMLPVTSFQ